MRRAGACSRRQTMTDYMRTTAGRPYDDIIKSHGRGELCVKSNIVNRSVRTWYTHQSLEILRLMSLPSETENSAILKLR